MKKAAALSLCCVTALAGAAYSQARLPRYTAQTVQLPPLGSGNSALSIRDLDEDGRILLTNKFNSGGFVARPWGAPLDLTPWLASRGIATADSKILGFGKGGRVLGVGFPPNLWGLLIADLPAGVARVVAPANNWVLSTTDRPFELSDGTVYAVGSDFSTGDPGLLTFSQTAFTGFFTPLTPGAEITTLSLAYATDGPSLFFRTYAESLSGSPVPPPAGLLSAAQDLSGIRSYLPSRPLTANGGLAQGIAGPTANSQGTFLTTAFVNGRVIIQASVAPFTTVDLPGSGNPSRPTEYEAIDERGFVWGGGVGALQGLAYRDVSGTYVPVSITSLVDGAELDFQATGFRVTGGGVVTSAVVLDGVQQQVVLYPGAPTAALDLVRTNGPLKGFPSYVGFDANAFQDGGAEGVIRVSRSEVLAAPAAQEIIVRGLEANTLCGIARVDPGSGAILALEWIGTADNSGTYRVPVTGVPSGLVGQTFSVRAFAYDSQLPGSVLDSTVRQVQILP